MRLATALFIGRVLPFIYTRTALLLHVWWENSVFLFFLFFFVLVLLLLYLGRRCIWTGCFPSHPHHHLTCFYFLYLFLSFSSSCLSVLFKLFAIADPHLLSLSLSIFYFLFLFLFTPEIFVSLKKKEMKKSWTCQPFVATRVIHDRLQLSGVTAHAGLKKQNKTKNIQEEMAENCTTQVKGKKNAGKIKQFWAAGRAKKFKWWHSAFRNRILMALVTHLKEERLTVRISNTFCNIGLCLNHNNSLRTVSLCASLSLTWQQWLYESIVCRAQGHTKIWWGLFLRHCAYETSIRLNTRTTFEFWFARLNCSKK